MPNKHGDFIWYELMTSDPQAARAFYEPVVGWTIEPEPSGEMDYRMIDTGTGLVGGVMRLTAEMTENGAQPCWMGYIGVDDVDASAKSIADAGGAVHVPPRDIPGVGRFAFVADPQGVMFYVMKGASDESSNAFAATEPMMGHCAWNELSTTDPDAAKAFYGAQFGWSQEGDLDMGPLGKYEFLHASGGRFALGAVMPKMPQMPMPFWTYYFRVPDIDAAVAAIGEHAGRIVQEPIEIPGGDFSMVGLDPQGAAFALVGARKG